MLRILHYRSADGLTTSEQGPRGEEPHTRRRRAIYRPIRWREANVDASVEQPISREYELRKVETRSEGFREYYYEEVL